MKEDENLLQELRGKTDYTSNQAILEFSNRKKPGKDPYYRNQVLHPTTAQLTKEQVESLRHFLPFFMKQRTYLQKKYLKLALTEQNLQAG